TKIENFYSDSYSDTPLARIAENAYLVKGDNLLPWDKE
ncbi:MAG: haloacid dehalogenase-like hydrolase, partial [Solobacterium sp.]|nr:haloacid dehalogenase-like hydrolase [Solobacterium sp.]